MFVQISWPSIPYDFPSLGIGRVPYTLKFYDLSQGRVKAEGLPFPSPRYLPNTGIEPVAPASPVLAGRFFTPEAPGKPNVII